MEGKDDKGLFVSGHKLAKGGRRSNTGPPPYLEALSKEKNRRRARRMFNLSMLRFLRFMQDDPWREGAVGWISERQSHYIEQCKYWINKYIPSATPEIYQLNFGQLQGSEVLILIQEAVSRLEPIRQDSQTQQSGQKSFLESPSTNGKEKLALPLHELESATPILPASQEPSVTTAASPSCLPDSEPGKLALIQEAAV